jgi:homocysteine S-methyltransferase
LERRGVDLRGSKLWSAQLLIDDPALVRAIHLDYLRAGAGARLPPWHRHPCASCD